MTLPTDTRQPQHDIVDSQHNFSNHCFCDAVFIWNTFLVYSFLVYWQVAAVRIPAMHGAGRLPKKIGVIVFAWQVAAVIPAVHASPD